MKPKAKKTPKSGFYKALEKCLSCQYRILTGRGLAVPVAKKIVIIVDIFIFISLLFILLPSWMALVSVILGAVFLSGADINYSDNESESELRIGLDGIGFYQDELRIDGGSIEDEDSYMKR